ncbi:YdbL family protein [Aliikangiella sp. IMCC44359]|uniref:YdbL family protein n=1 Tax=Aliikangiella sp. IMCC44359 TaxID=3459125 RepID=UPI00403ABDA5
MKTSIKRLLVIFLFLSSSAFALDLSSAKKDGLVGEQFNGYLGIVTGTNPEVASLVKEINRKRKQHYEQIAQKRNTKLKQVELVAGNTAIKKTLKGNYIKLQGASWKKK